MENKNLIPKMLNHAAYVTHDVEATARFYIDVLGLPIATTIIDDRIPSTGDPFPYFHIFFRLADGSTIAFFESPGLPPAKSKGHPAYDIFDHIALEVESPEVLAEWENRLKSKGVEFIGPIDHEGLILSIYFHDPSGHRLELTTPLTAEWNHDGERGERELKIWLEAKAEASRTGRDMKEAMLDLIAQHRATAL